MRREEFLQKVLTERSSLKEKVTYLKESLENSHLCLTYDDLRDGGALTKSVKDFAFFPDVSCNGAFINLINFTEGCEPGNGLCENMVRYNQVSVGACCDHQENDVAEAAMTLMEISLLL